MKKYLTLSAFVIVSLITSNGYADDNNLGGGVSSMLLLRSMLKFVN